MRQFSLPLTAILLSLPLVVCSYSSSGTAMPSTGQTDQHDHDAHAEHDHPETLEEGLRELSELRDTVRDGFAADDVDTAHGPLHDVGHLLEDISGLIEREELSQEQRELAKQNIDSLFDLFGDVDSALHGQDGTTYSEVSDQIDAAIAALQEVADQGSASSESAESVDSEGNEAPEE